MDDLARDVDLLCLDAGNVVIFLDHARLAALVGAAGYVVSADVLVAAEGEAKALAETGGLVDVAWSGRGTPSAVAWGKMVGTIAKLGGLDVSRLPALLDAAWETHQVLNLWTKVPDGLGTALDRIRASGVKVAIISNSEGMLDRLFADLGIAQHFDLVVDSGRIGIEKPDPRIFQIAMSHFGISPKRTLHLGDTFATDILGARNAHIRHALIDPFGHYTGRHQDVPRAPGVVEVADAILRIRSRKSSTTSSSS